MSSSRSKEGNNWLTHNRARSVIQVIFAIVSKCYIYDPLYFPLSQLTALHTMFGASRSGNNVWLIHHFALKLLHERCQNLTKVPVPSQVQSDYGRNMLALFIHQRRLWVSHKHAGSAGLCSAVGMQILCAVQGVCTGCKWGRQDIQVIILGGSLYLQPIRGPSSGIVTNRKPT